jgi:predicted ATPase
VYVSRAHIPEHLRPDQGAAGRWPFTVPAVAHLLEEDLVFTAPVTVLVGDNGSGKSTLVEAIAEGFGLDAAGGKAGTRYRRPDPVRTALGEVLRLQTTGAGARMLAGPRLRKQGFFLRAETAFRMTERLGGVHGFWEADTAAMSHGEAYVTMFAAMMDKPGFYVLDEPESALSFTSSLQLVALLQELGRGGAQVVCATHSPILAATPGADIIEVGEHGFARVSWQDLALVDHWRRFMAHPEAYLRHLGADDVRS